MPWYLSPALWFLIGLFIGIFFTRYHEWFDPEGVSFAERERIRTKLIAYARRRWGRRGLKGSLAAHLFSKEVLERL